MKVTLEMTETMVQLLKIASEPYTWLETYTEAEDMAYVVQTFLEWAIRSELYNAIKNAPWDKVSEYVRDGMRTADPYMYENTLHTFKMCEYKDEKGNELTDDELRKEAYEWQAQREYVKLWEG